MPPQERAYQPNIETSKDDQIEQMLMDFCAQGNYPAKDIEEAYLKFLAGEHCDDPQVEALLREMQTASEQDFPLNRFVRIINRRHAAEAVLPAFEQLVSSINVTPNEKEVLQSIVKKKRSGVLEISQDGQTITEIRIKVTQDGSQEELAHLLTQAIEAALAKIPQGSQIEISFTE